MIHTQKLTLALDAIEVKEMKEVDYQCEVDVHSRNYPLSSPTESIADTMEELGVSGASVRSANIPLPRSHIDRTPSEIQLHMDTVAAEQREIRMFYRMVNGLRERHRQMGYEDNAPTIVEGGDYAQPFTNDLFHSPNQAVYPAVVSQDLCPLIPQDTEPQEPGKKPEDFVGYTTDEWSITGFEVETHSHPEAAFDSSDEQGIFDMDL